MQVKTSELAGVALNWAVAKCEGAEFRLVGGVREMKFPELSWVDWVNYSTDWSQSGPIIEREKISLIRCDDDFKAEKGFTTNTRVPVWAAEHGGGHSAQESYGSQGDNYGEEYGIAESACSYGETALIATMRCFVHAKLGDVVDVPDELA